MVLSVNEVDPIRAGVPRGGRDGPEAPITGPTAKLCRPNASPDWASRVPNVGSRHLGDVRVRPVNRTVLRAGASEHLGPQGRCGVVRMAQHERRGRPIDRGAALPRQREIVHVAPGRFAEPRRNVLHRARPPMSGSGAGGQLHAASGCAARGSEAAAPKSRDGAEDISTRDSWQREAIRGIRSRSAHAARDAVILPAGPSSGPGSQRSRPSWTSARQRPDSACHGRSGPGRHRRGGDPLPTFADPQHGDEGVARRGVRPPAAIPPWRASHAAPPAPDPSAVDRPRLTLVERVHQLERPFFEGQTARDAACRPVRVGRRPRTGIGRYGGA